MTDEGRVDYLAGKLEDWADLASDMISEVTNPDAQKMLQVASLLFRSIADLERETKVAMPSLLAAMLAGQNND